MRDEVVTLELEGAEKHRKGFILGFYEAFRKYLISGLSKEEFADLFPDCATGAMPPFGNLYGVPVYVDRSMSEEPGTASLFGLVSGACTFVQAEPRNAATSVRMSRWAACWRNRLQGRVRAGMDGVGFDMGYLLGGGMSKPCASRRRLVFARETAVVTAS